ncbi:MAG: hypothetical protein IPP69_04565 [Flavobacteriales bacterium]|nr:hypothetical protein [Flavobacteriales bacterium]
MNVNSGWYYFFNDEGNKGFPFQAEGDFNHDGKEDVAYLLIHQDNKDGLLVCACSIKDECFLIKLDAFDANKLQENMIASENSVELCNDTGSNSLSTKGTYFKDDVIMIGPYASDFLSFYIWNAERSAFEGGWYPCEVEEE